MSTSAGFRPTTYVTILRTTPEELTDEFGDPVDNATPAATGIPWAISHQSQRQWLPAENRTTIVNTVAGRCRGNVDVKNTDRLKDERTGRIYLIEGMVHPQDPVGSAAISMVLKEVQNNR